jgi:hypothetical protein
MIPKIIQVLGLGNPLVLELFAPPEIRQLGFGNCLLPSHFSLNFFFRHFFLHRLNRFTFLFKCARLYEADDT